MMGMAASDEKAAVSYSFKEFFIDNLLVRIHFIIVMIRWTGQVEFPFPGSLTSTFLCSSQVAGRRERHDGDGKIVYYGLKPS